MPPSGPPIWTALIVGAVAEAAGDVLAELPHGHPEGDLVDARPGEALVEADELRAGGLGVGAEGAVGGGAGGRDEGDVAERLDVVDDGRHPVDAALGGERRAGRDGPAQALDAGEQRRLLADHIRAGALDDRHVEVEVGAEDAVAEQARARAPRRRRAPAPASTAGTRSGRGRSRGRRRPRSRRAPSPRAAARGCAPSGTCRCRSRGRPRHRWRR